MSSRRTGAIAFGLLASLSGCAGDASPALDAVPEGSWGGEHAALQVDASGADYELDCAHGRMESPLRLIAEGRFDVVGFYVPEGGPTRESPPQLPARFAGSSDGARLTFSITLRDTGQTIGPFTVVRAQPPRLVKCL